MNARLKVLLCALFLIPACGDLGDAPYDGEEDEEGENVPPGSYGMSPGATSADKDGGGNRWADAGGGGATEWDAGKWNDAGATGQGKWEDASSGSSWADAGRGDGGWWAPDAGSGGSWGDGGAPGDAGRADAGRSDGGAAESCANLTYDSFGREFLMNYCVGCHGATNPRNGIRLDSLAAITMRKNNAKNAVLSGSMPQGNRRPSDQERQRFGQFLDCGPR